MHLLQELLIAGLIDLICPVVKLRLLLTVLRWLVVVLQGLRVQRSATRQLSFCVEERWLEVVWHVIAL